MRIFARRGVARLLAVVLPAVGLAIVPATAGMAARCGTNAHAYVRDDFSLAWYTVSETDPVDPATFPHSFQTSRMPQSGLLTFGANGITPGQYPFWNFYNSSGAMVKTIIGSKTGDNCVSNQVTYFMDLPSDTYSVRVSYYRGNTGGTVVQQKHFQVNLAPVLSGGPFTLRNIGYSTDCMDLAFGDPTNGTAIGRFPCDGAANRKWFVENSGLTRVCHGVFLGHCGSDYDLFDTVRIRSVATGKCADIDPGNLSNGGPIREWDCNGTNSQRWVVQRSTRFGGFTFFNAHVRDQINEAKAIDASPGYQLQLWDAFGDSVVQAWDVQPA